MDFWELTVRFFSLADLNVRYVIAGSIFLGGAAGGLGSFAFLQKRSLLGDSIAHAALPGICLAFMVAGKKDFILLLIGAALAGWLGSLTIDFIVNKTKLKLDTALGIVLTVYFGLGIVLLTYIQKTGSGNQSGLDKFLFGQAAAMTARDVITLVIIGVVMLITIFLFYGKFKLITFDPGFAQAIGLKVGWLQFILTTMIVMSVTIGLQAVGVVLMAAMLITPAAAARQWTDNLGRMIVYASLLGALSGLLGAYISFLAPKYPTGPWMVVVISVIFAISLLFAPKRGMVHRLKRHLDNRKKMTYDHILKALFKAGQDEKNWQEVYSVDEIKKMWSFTQRELKAGLNRLRRRNLVATGEAGYYLTPSGVVEGGRILRLHRLWEVYLSRYLDLKHDHVHRDAEEMEHIITPEIEEQLLILLDSPEYDPHRQEIPYVKREDIA